MVQENNNKIINNETSKLELERFLKFRDANFKFVVFNDNEPKVFIFNGCKVIEKKNSKTGKKELVMRYFFLNPDTKTINILDSQSYSLAEKMKEIDVGKPFAIKRIKVGNTVKYKVIPSRW